jgi:hypothetical protein
MIEARRLKKRLSHERDLFAYSLSFDLGSERINRRAGGVVYDSLPIISLELNNKPVSVPQFSHAMFLCRISEMI